MVKRIAAAATSLGEYSAKRAFDATPEPAPGTAPHASGPLLFVIQQHNATRLHYDLRLECGGVLKSWAVPKGPSLDPSEKRLAMLTEDHPYGYASFEGVIPPKQYGAGEVIVWDCGVYSPDEPATHFADREAAEAQVREGLAKGKLSFQLRGEKVKGSFALVRTAKDPKSWLLIKHKDRFVTPADLAARNRSVLSGATVEDLIVVPGQRIEAARLVPGGKPSRLPARVAPMLAAPGDRALASPDWMWEPRIGGTRALAFVDDGRVRLRAGEKDLAPQFPEVVAELLRDAPGAMLLDGMIAASPAVYVCFDLLHFAGVDLRGAAYEDRRRYLSQCLMPSPHVQLVHASEDGAALLDAAIASGFKGVVGKKKASKYEAGKKGGAWVEVTKGRKGALPPGLGPRLRGGDSRHGSDSRHGGDSDLLAQLDNRKPAFTLEIAKARIKLTNLERVYWPANPALKQPAYTKRDLLRYFAAVGPLIVPHLADRPLTMIRMPEGIRGQRFFQKHWEQERPDFVESVAVFSGHKDERHEYLLCNNVATLLWLAQSGTLEFHVWHSRARPGPDCASKRTDFASSLESLEASVLNYPDWVVFDIDPYIYSGKEKPGDEPELNTTAFEKGKEIAFALREILHGMALEPVVKTSGKTGLHIFVPIRRTLDFDAARHVSEMVSRHLGTLRPKEVTVEWSVPKRTGKIFMDFNMNVRGKTLNVAYSPRGEPGAPVSMPLTWDELATAHPLDFRIDNAPERLARLGDRWADVLERKQDLQKALKNAGG
ncbi:MAG TPA: DNA polymerase ligase N-terminal domain-containing protein [Usitatibacter sp.]|nr:DNA polymerase ligase N-terminal domain-containing protein [Usitatibacter sp.]